MTLCAVIEDNPLQGRVLADSLRAAGYEVTLAGTGRQGLDRCRERRPEVALLDLGLPDVEGLDLIPRILETSPLTRIVVLTGRDSVASAVAALRAGARHYLVKPWDSEELLLVVEREAQAVSRQEIRQRAGGGATFWGRDPAMARVRSQIRKLAGSAFTSLLVQGETGTGKEVVARELHRLTASAGPFVALNCVAVPGELLESELFGHEKGAFTGAQARRRGVVELADGGTLFLDEVAEMAPPLQAKLLRFLDNHRYRRVGGEEELTSRCRLVAATHRDLEAMADSGAFRPDFYFRLAVVRVLVPPLRERGGDLLPLASHLLASLGDSLGRSPRPLSPEAEKAILRHRWPGNVRELRNRLERALVLGEEAQIQPWDLDLRADSGSGAGDSGEGVLESRDRLRRALEHEGWNISRTARRLGVERHRLRYRIEKFGLSEAEEP